jgi:hypothetical protein
MQNIKVTGTCDRGGYSLGGQEAETSKEAGNRIYSSKAFLSNLIPLLRPHHPHFLPPFSSPFNYESISGLMY